MTDHAHIASTRAGSARAFTLLELLIVVAVIALLLGILLPSLAAARESARAAACASNLRQIVHACTMYADANHQLSPALGIPWGSPPAWPLVVLQWADIPGDTADDLYRTNTILICASAQQRHTTDMQRTYAINTTGHSGIDDDPDNFDTAPVSIRTDRIPHPSRATYFVDSDHAPAISGAPPSARTPSTIDFRQPAHVEHRLGRYHAARAFMRAAFDASIRPFTAPEPHWIAPLP